MRACVIAEGPHLQPVPPRCFSLRGDKPPAGAAHFTQREARWINKHQPLFHGLCVGGPASDRHGWELGEAIPPGWFDSWGGLYVTSGRPKASDFAYMSCGKGIPTLLQITVEAGDAYALDEDELGWAELADVPAVRSYAKGYTEEFPYWDQALPLPRGGALQALPAHTLHAVQQALTRAWSQFDWATAWDETSWVELAELRGPVEAVAVRAAPSVVAALRRQGKYLPALRLWGVG